MLMLSIYATATALFVFFARYFFGVSESLGGTAEPLWLLLGFYASQSPGLLALFSCSRLSVTVYYK